MDPGCLLHAACTCEWGRFGVVIEQLESDRSRVDDVFWACHHPAIAPTARAVQSDECRCCPLWDLALRHNSRWS